MADFKKEHLLILRTEIVTNAAKYQVAGEYLPHDKIAAMFDERIDDATEAEIIDAVDIVSSIDADDIGALSKDDRYLLELYCAAGQVKPTQVVRRFLKQAFPDGGKSDRLLTKLLKRRGTVAEKLGIPQPTPNDIADILVREKGKD